MRKIIILLVFAITLLGCEDNNLPQNEIEALKDETMALQSNYEKLQEEFQGLQTAFVDQNTSLVEMKDQISILMQMVNNDVSIYPRDYLDYLSSYGQDGIQASEDYEVEYAYMVGIEDQSLTLDLVKHVDYSDQSLIESLNVDTSKPIVSGGYLHELGIRRSYEMSDNFKIFIYDWEDNLQLISIATEVYEKDYLDSGRLFKVEMIHEKIFRITERFLN